MKKAHFKFLYLILILLAAILCLCACNNCNGCKSCNNSQDNTENTDGNEDNKQEPDDTSDNNGDTQAQVQTYTVIFILDGKEQHRETYEENSLVKKPSITDKDDSIFMGWYTDVNYTILWDFSGDTVKRDTVLYGYYTQIEEIKYNVLYYSDDQLIRTDKLEKGERAQNIIPESKDGYKFVGWYCNNERYNFNSPVQQDITLVAKFEIIEFSVRFLVDGALVEERKFTIENMTVTEPAIPEKQYYTSDWESYELTLANIEVNAVYTAIHYTAKYVDYDGSLIKNIEFTADDVVSEPALPVRTGYTVEWSGKYKLGENVTVKAIYTPIVYTITYISMGEIIQEYEYTVENKKITPPTVPEKTGFTGRWESKEITYGDITINAVYEAITYSATFKFGDEILTVIYFDVVNFEIETPAPPSSDREGYTLEWQNYVLKLQDITINLEYIPIEYSAKFYADGNLVEQIPFTIETKSITSPAIPEKEHYTSEWEEFELGLKDISVNAKYTPIVYTITFKSDGVEIPLTYTVENKKIKEPDPTPRDGYNVTWPEYTLNCENITIEAIYEKIEVSEVEVSNFTYEEMADGTLRVTGYTGDETEIIVPQTYNDKSIKNIGANAFAASNLTSINISYGIEIIEEYAFAGCIYLQQITLPNSVKKIEKYAFSACAFETIKLPNSLEIIEDYAFSGSKITTITIPGKVSVINNIFYNCEKLTSVILGDGVQSILTEAFNKCKKLASIYISASVTLIEKAAIKECPALANVTFEDCDSWYWKKDENANAKQITSKQLSNTSTAAKYLTEVYNGYIIFKETD